MPPSDWVCGCSSLLRVSSMQDNLKYTGMRLHPPRNSLPRTCAAVGTGNALCSSRLKEARILAGRDASRGQGLAVSGISGSARHSRMIATPRALCARPTRNRPRPHRWQQRRDALLREPRRIPSSPPARYQPRPPLALAGGRLRAAHLTATVTHPQQLPFVCGSWENTLLEKSAGFVSSTAPCPLRSPFSD